MKVTFYNKRGETRDFHLSTVSGQDLGPGELVETRDQFDLPYMSSESVQMVSAEFGIMYGGMEIRETQEARFNRGDDEDFVEMHFTLAGEGLLNDIETGHEFHFNSNEHNLHYMPNFVGRSLYEKDTSYKFFEVRFRKAYFLELACNSSPVLTRFAGKVIADDLAAVNERNMPISPGMHRIIQEIMCNSFTGGLKKMFLQSKCIELLAMQTQAYEQDAGLSVRVKVNSSDKERLHFAREYMLKHIGDPPTLRELARLAGINEFKLKNGFREVFGNTVFGYLNDHKLEEARRELEAGSYSIKELTDRFNYSSVPHFTRAFRKKFGITPGQLRRGEA